uniref:Uncharacterized protein n=1 Tax=Eutreptiella gymnastica TaxID=73025 RepID=A0A7S4CLB4_9EUGL
MLSPMMSCHDLQRMLNPTSACAAPLPDSGGIAHPSRAVCGPEVPVCQCMAELVASLGQGAAQESVAQLLLDHSGVCSDSQSHSLFFDQKCAFCLCSCTMMALCLFAQPPQQIHLVIEGNQNLMPNCKLCGE